MAILSEKQRRASEAERLLNEPLLQEALEKIEKDSINEMLKLPFWSDKKRRMILDRINTIRGIKSYLKSTILTGSEKRTLI